MVVVVVVSVCQSGTFVLVAHTSKAIDVGIYRSTNEEGDNTVIESKRAIIAGLYNTFVRFEHFPNATLAIIHLLIFII